MYRYCIAIQLVTKQRAMKSPFEFGTVFGEVFLDTSLELPCGDIISCHYIQRIEFLYYGEFSKEFCYMVRFQFASGFDEDELRSELEGLAVEYAEQMNSVQDCEPAA